MKNWMNADLVVVDITETANGEHTMWYEGSKKGRYSTHKSGIDPNPATVEEPVVIEEETPGDDTNTRS